MDLTISSSLEVIFIKYRKRKAYGITICLLGRKKNYAFSLGACLCNAIFWRISRRCFESSALRII